MLQVQDPRQWNVEGPEVRVSSTSFRHWREPLPGISFLPRFWKTIEYCQECHADVHETWSYSVHRWSSFNNDPYLFSVRETRRDSFARDGSVQAARFCAGCHDPVVFFSGRFDDPDFDDVNDPTAHAGITCTVCHSITHVNSPRGNADYTIEEPEHYPFAFSVNPALAFVNRQLVKAKPELHKKTFLKPLHKTTEFCGTCHKVHLPKELNGYKWLRGQNHYDSFLLSGVSGSWCCELLLSGRIRAQLQRLPHGASAVGRLRRANATKPRASCRSTIISSLRPIRRSPNWKTFPSGLIDRHFEFNEGVVRLDLFGIKRGGVIDGELIAPLRPEIPVLQPGERLPAREQ